MKSTLPYSFLVLGMFGCMLMPPAGAQWVDVDATNPLELIQNANEQRFAESQILPVGH